MTERVKCEHCNGKGTLKKVPGSYYRTFADGRRRPRCMHCQGYGYNDTGMPATKAIDPANEAKRPSDGAPSLTGGHAYTPSSQDRKVTT